MTTQLRACLTVLSGLTMLAFAGCSSDAGVVQAEISWRTTCDVSGGCVGGVAHTIHAIDGEGGNSVSCDLTRTSGNPATYALTFTAQKNDPANGLPIYGISVDTAFSDGIVAGGCTVDAYESSNTFEGACTSNAPTETAPCQLDELVVDSGDVSGTLYCEGIKSLANANKIEVQAPAGAGPLEFTFKNCR